tara:strand:- start:1011 stop:1343 length:333 start_codon:yes stop_codon:yes gene_type:complete
MSEKQTLELINYIKDININPPTNIAKFRGRTQIKEIPEQRFEFENFTFLVSGYIQIKYNYDNKCNSECIDTNNKIFYGIYNKQNSLQNLTLSQHKRITEILDNKLNLKTQ